MLNAWWQSLDFTLQIFWGLGIATTLVLLIQMVMLLFGLDGHDHDFDSHGVGDGAHDGHSDFGSLLSVRTVTAFFTGFAWSGIAALDAGFSTPAAIAIASLVGFAFMVGVFFLMRGLYALRASGTLDYQNAIGTVGTVYLNVPAAMASTGQVEVMVQGRLCVVQAFTRAEQPLPNRTRVRVTEVLGPNTLVVEPLAAPAAPAAATSAGPSAESPADPT